MSTESVTAAVNDLPIPAVKELLSKGVCAHCVFRLFGVPDCVYSTHLLSLPVLSSTLKTIVVADMAKNGHSTEEDISNLQCLGEAELETGFCRICLGILQFAYLNEKHMVQTKVCANDFAASIVEFVKREGHTFDSFSLEVSLPTSIAENEQAIWLYLQRKYSSELWFHDNSVPTRISVKDVLKLLITDPLENLLGNKSGSSSSLRIRLTYTNGASPTKAENSTEKTETNKRRKTGTDDSGVSNGCGVAENDNLSLKSCNGLGNNKSPDRLYFELEKVNKPCNLSVSCSRNPVFIGGRYLKYSRNVSQTRWVIDDERVGEASVEEIIGSNILPACGGDSYKFHAAGREDIDVRMLGSGRPFLIEIQNARHVPSESSMKRIEEKINSLENKLVGVKNVKEMGGQGWDLMREGESEKQKQYAAVAWISRPLEDDDLKILSSFNDMPILQKTPIRVLHRRSPLERQRIIHWMKIERISGSRQYFLLHLCTQAGTYIKEFVHGDLGRTHPSIGSILGCRAEILQLDVTDVKMDCFLNE